jgi:septum formation inhibitor-activating ATPase MinD
MCVASGKVGVAKATRSSNLAVALVKEDQIKSRKTASY